MHLISSDIDPDLRQIINAWHDLPDAVKARILDIAKPYARTPTRTAGGPMFWTP